jgi:hypothetical protein
MMRRFGCAVAREQKWRTLPKETVAGWGIRLRRIGKKRSIGLHLKHRVNFGILCLMATLGAYRPLAVLLFKVCQA